MKDLTLRTFTAAAAVLLIAACAWVGGFSLPETALALGGLGMGFLVKDALLKKTHALPNGAATTSGVGLDLGHGTFGDFVADAEFLVTAPILTVGELADAQTITYSIEHDDDDAFGAAAAIFNSVLVQTGAGGAGAAAATFRGRLPVDVKRHVRLKTVKAGASNASTKSATLELLT